jgi:SAM-dependent methyltransferase
MASFELYDQIGREYGATRREDPRIANAIHAALGDARSVVNVGAGTGAYEPRDRDVVAVEPSAVMLAQRPPGAAAAVQAEAEALPFDDKSFDAALTVLSDHHWRDRTQGLRELARVARRRVVLFNLHPAQAERFWLTREYLPGFLRLIPDHYRRSRVWERDFEDIVGPLRVEAVPIPHDCKDGFYGALWRRPEAYLDRRVRDTTSVFARLPEDEVAEALERLRGDLESGAWSERHAGILERDELDIGYRIAIADVARRPRASPRCSRSTSLRSTRRS